MKEEILKLKQGECFIVPEGDYGKAEVWRINDVFIVFEIPLFGGEPMYSKTYHHSRIEEIIYDIISFN